MNKIEKLNFPNFCYSIGMIPTSYKLSLSYEEQLFWFCDFLEDTVIPTVNNNGLAVEELQNLFTTLKNYVDNYFENLDVQEEINNKLDEMVEDGTLSEILANFFNNATFCFNNIYDLKNANFLVNGNFVKTLGYHSINDGGAGLYKIINDNLLEDGGTIINISNNLKAKLIITDCINPNQFGAYGDGIHDDTIALQNCLNNNYNLKIVFLKNYTYLISDQLIVNRYSLIDFNNAIIKSSSQNGCVKVTSDGSFNRQHFLNFNFDGNFKSDYGLIVTNVQLFGEKIEIKNCKINHLYAYKDQITGRGNVLIDNIQLRNEITSDEEYYLVRNSIGAKLETTDSQLNGGGTFNLPIAFDVSSSTLIENIHSWNYWPETIENGIMFNCHGGVRIVNCYCDGIPIFAQQNLQTQYSNISISNSIFHFTVNHTTLQRNSITPIIKGELDKVNITNSSFETDWLGGHYSICNRYENTFLSNIFGNNMYYENFYKGQLSDENIGTLHYERINNILYFEFIGSGTSSNSASFINRLPTWARPKITIRTPLTAGNTNTTCKITITDNGEVNGITTTPYSNATFSFPARYKLQSYNN